MKTTAKLLKAIFIICWLFSTIGCDIRDPEAQFLEGQKYANGDGVLEDEEEALKWFRLAAEQGHAEAQYNIAVFYYNGDGVPQDHVMAYAWGNLAGAHGHSGDKWSWEKKRTFANDSDNLKIALFGPNL